MKAVIFDSGTLITFSMNCMLHIFRDLKKNFNGKFIITREIEQEIVNNPLTIKKYKLGALRLKSLIDEGVLEFPESVNINSKDVSRISRDIIKEVNSYFYVNNNPVHLIDLGESSILALSLKLSEKNIDHVIAMDERTTRILCEKPQNLKSLMEEKLHRPVKQGSLRIQLPKVNFLRSSELVYVAFKKGIIKNQSKDMLDAMLYATKFKGSSISSEEIKEIERL
ncbi:MAG: hypothetical protein AABX03_01035 [Nanoarchaeota archaeon]